MINYVLRKLFTLLWLALPAGQALSQPGQALYPKPYGVIPAANQLKWHELETYVLVHFTPTTFENKEWGYGDADPSVFNPTAFDASQIAAAAAAGGFKGLVLVAKHHDGFALWPTKTTAYNISKSPWKNGKGDMVKDFEQAARKNGLQFGVYCSPWDRNFPSYGNHDYVKAYREQLKELYTRYGKLFITWFDGANGGDGYYGGAREKRNIDRASYYGWDTTWQLVRRLQPDAVIFSDMGDVRWVGNEEGHAAETSWATFTPEPLDGKNVAVPGELKYWKSPEGTRNGQYWKPAECDVPLRPGWFYHPDQDHRVKTPEQLFDLYFKSVGRGAALDLGLSPDTRGLLHKNDVESLKAFGLLLQETFRVNLAKNASLTASNIRGKKAALFGTAMLVDNDRYSYWATDDAVRTADLVLEWKSPQVFNIIRIRENIKLGQRIERVAIDARLNGQWQEITQTTSIGANRLVRLKQFVRSDAIRIRVLESPVSIAVSDVGVFKEPDQLPRVSYSMATAQGSLDKTGWKVVSFSYQSKLPAGAAKHAIDGDPNTIWHTWDNEHEMKAPPQEIVVDMGSLKTIGGFTYLPRNNGPWGIVSHFEWQVSEDGRNWASVATGEFANIRSNPIEQVVRLKDPVHCRYFKFIGKSSVEDNYISAAELGVIGTPGSAAGKALVVKPKNMDTASLRRAIIAETSKYPEGEFAVACKNLANGQQFFLNEQAMFHAASTMKTPVMMEAFRQAAAGKFSLQDKLVVNNRFSSIVDGSVYSLRAEDDSEQEMYALEGKELTIFDIMHRMITKSSNLATNIMIELVGAKQVMATMHALGANKIQVLRGVEDGKAFQAGLNNVTNAYDLMVLFEHLASGSFVSRQACDQMIGILQDQFFRDIIPAKLPAGLRTATKSGSITKICHDSGIVYLPDGRTYVLVLLSRGIENHDRAAAALADISKLVYDHLN